MTAAVEQLPALASMALLTSAASQPAWREMRKLAGGQFESSTRLVSSDPHVFSDAMLHSPEQVVRWIDGFIDNMAAWRDLIAARDSETIDKAFAAAWPRAIAGCKTAARATGKRATAPPVERPVCWAACWAWDPLTDAASPRSRPVDQSVTP